MERDDLREVVRRVVADMDRCHDEQRMPTPDELVQWDDDLRAALSGVPEHTVEDRILEANEFFKSKGVGYDLPAPTEAIDDANVREHSEWIRSTFAPTEGGE